MISDTKLMFTTRQLFSMRDDVPRETMIELKLASIQLISVLR